MKQLEQADELRNLIESSPILAVQFGTKTCGPCAAIRSKLDDWSRDRETVRYIYVSVEDFPELAAAESVFTVPALLVYVEGRLTIRETGCFSLLDVLNRIERYQTLLS